MRTLGFHFLLLADLNWYFFDNDNRDTSIKNFDCSRFEIWLVLLGNRMYRNLFLSWLSGRWKNS